MQQPIQQQIPQPEQMGGQQVQQQMVLCPVRVVYETQILMPPGDQGMQQNQTYFINPQNPPPWVQNRQVQNPVIYVQQMPNSIAQPIPQHMEQNQLYLPHYQNYQQILPQQIIPQNQEQRHLQLAPNIIQPSIIQNFQTNINTSVQNLNDRNIQQTFGQVQNIQMPQTQVNVASNNANRNEATMPNIVQAQNQAQPQPQSQFSSQKVEIKPGVFMNVGQPINQSPMRPPPQVLTVNPMQNPIQAIPQTITSSASIQSLPPNPALPRQVQTQSVGSQMSPPTFANTPNTPGMSRIRKVAPNTVSRMTNTTQTARNASYKPIQPRPFQYKPNHQTVSTYSQTYKSVLNTAANVGSMNTPTPSMLNIQPTVPNTTTPKTYIKSEDNINTNRKRKSESPDEIHKKMAAIQVDISTPQGKINIAPKPAVITFKPCTTDVPNNTPMQELIPKQNFNISVPPNNDKTVELSTITQLIENVQHAIISDQVFSIKPDSKDSQSTDKDKLVRNTVFTQARGRTLNDKEPVLPVFKETTIVPIPDTKLPPRLEERKLVENIIEITRRPMENHENNANQVEKTYIHLDRIPKQEKNINYTHIDNINTSKEKTNTHIENINTHQEKPNTHIENINTSQEKPNTHIENNNTQKENTSSYIENINTHKEKPSKHTEKSHTNVDKNITHIENNNTHKEKTNTHIENINTHKEKPNKHIEKSHTNVDKNITHIENNNTHKEKTNTHSEKNNTHEDKTNTHTEKHNTHKEKSNTHLEKQNIHKEEKPNTHVEKKNTHKEKTNTDKEKTNTHTKKTNTHAEKKNTHKEKKKRHTERKNSHKEKTNTHIEKNHTHKENKVDVKKEMNTMNHDMQATLNTANNKGMLPVDRGTKQERDFVLTHVLDGIVIQESNVAFPIREPTTRRSIQQITTVKNEKVKSEALPNKVDVASILMPPPRSSFEAKVERETKMDAIKPEQDDNPFSNLKHATVKSWTIVELAANLSKRKWEETASLFLEHEIDGESLYLVSKTQLTNIGVKEDHADIICAFVKS